MSLFSRNFAGLCFAIHAKIDWTERLDWLWGNWRLNPGFSDPCWNPDKRKKKADKVSEHKMFEVAVGSIFNKRLNCYVAIAAAGLFYSSTVEGRDSGSVLLFDVLYWMSLSYLMCLFSRFAFILASVAEPLQRPVFYFKCCCCSGCSRCGARQDLGQWGKMSAVAVYYCLECVC